MTSSVHHLGAACVSAIFAWIGAALVVAFDDAAFAQSASTAAAPPSAEPAMSPGRRFSQTNGAALYGQVCAACHMSNAEGAVGAAAYPPLARNPKLEAAGYPVIVLLYGFRSMPALGRMMADEQVAEVVNYVRTHFGNSYDDPVSAADVKAARP
jgi:mono/diheme cytochrome c family protein